MLVLKIELLRGIFEGGDPDDPSLAEWPPSPMRVFSAMVDSADLDRHQTLLQRVESLSQPEIRASRASLVTRRSYVPTNAMHPAISTTTLPGRTNNERQWARAIPESAVVEYVWSDEVLSTSEIAELNAIARRIPYVGRSSSPALVSWMVAAHDEGATERLVPYEQRTADRFRPVVTLRTPFPGSLAALRRAYDTKMSTGSGDPWAVGVRTDFGHLDPAPESIDAGPFEEMVVLRLVGRYLDGRNTAAACRHVRRALMARVGDPAVQALHGHHDGTVTQIAVVGLPHVGHERSDGHLLGIAVCLPRMERPDLIRVASALPAAGEVLEVAAGRLGGLRLGRMDPSDLASGPWGLRQSRWRRPSRRWVTALPLVSDHFLKPGDPMSEAMARIVANAGLPPLARLIDWDRRPLIAGGVDLKPSDTLRRPNDRARKPYFHASFELERPVRGPVVVGSMRNYGLGLCAPLNEITRGGGE